MSGWLTPLAALAAITMLAQAGGDARWTSHTVSATGPTEALACAAAREKASAHARNHLALNVGTCRCLPAAKGQDRQCRLSYEILQKKT